MKKTLLLAASSWLLAHAAAFGQALTGTVTVGGAAPTYPTLTAAVADLQARGVGAGGLTVALRPGTYAERIVLTTLAGASAANPVRFVGRGGPVTLRPVGTSATGEAVVSVTACDYLTFDSLNVADGGNSAANRLEVGYYLTGTATKGSTRVTVSSCAVRMGGGPDPVVVGTRGVWVVSAATSAAGTNDFNRILNVRVDKVAVGIQFAGKANFSGQPTFPDQGNEVRGCVLGGQRFIGIDNIDNAAGSGSALGIAVGSQRRLQILDNRLDSVLLRNATPILPVNASAISLDNASGRVSGNRIGYVSFDGTGGSLATGIRASIILGDTLKVFNNFIGGISRVDYVPGASDNSLYALGIWLFKQAGGGGTTQAFHNTIVLPAQAQPVRYSAACFYLNGGSGGSFPAALRNNILVNRLSTGPGQFAFAVVDGNSVRGNLLSNNNLLLASGTNGAVGQTNRELGGTRVTSLTLADWRTNSGYDPASVSLPVAFANEATGSLYLTGTALGNPALTGPFLAAVPRDLDGRLRSTSAPYLGAAEGAIVSSSAGAAARLLGLQLYPNPAPGAATLRFWQPLAGPAQVAVLDGLGRTVRTFAPVAGAPGFAQLPLALPGLAPGLYHVRVTVPGPDGRPVAATVRLTIAP